MTVASRMSRGSAEIFRIRRPELAGRAVVLRVLGHEIQLSCTADAKARGPAHCPEVRLGESPVVDGIADVAIPFGRNERETDGRACHGQVGMALHSARREAAVCGLDARARCIFRPAREDVDRTARRVAAVQRALRALEHLDALEVEEARDRELGAAEVDAVHVSRDHATGADLVRNAPQGQPGAEHADVVDDQAGHVELQAVQVALSGVGKGLGAQHRDAHRHLADVLFDLARGDDDLVERHRDRRRARSRRQRGCENEEGAEGLSRGHDALSPPQAAGMRKASLRRPGLSRCRPCDGAAGWCTIRSAVADTRTYRFGNCELDLGAHELRRDGKSVALERRPFQLLEMLVSRRGLVVTREEIIGGLWPPGIVIDFDTGLNTLVRKVRAALGDSPEAPAFIVTVPGVGYRFIAEIADDDPPPPLQRSRPRWLSTVAWALPLAAAVAVLAWFLVSRSDSSVSILVLPFENLTNDEDLGYLAAGLAEDTNASLAQADPKNLRLVGRATASEVARSGKSAAEIGRDLGVDFVVESSLRAERPKLRVTSRLVRVADNSQVWSASFDRELTSTLGLQRELSIAIAEQVRLRLSPGVNEAVARRQTQNPEAYDLYLRGRYAWGRISPLGNREALSYFQQAIDRDPGYALAWAGVLHVLSTAPITGEVDPATVAARAAEAAVQAQKFGAQLPGGAGRTRLLPFRARLGLAGLRARVAQCGRIRPQQRHREPHARPRAHAARKLRRRPGVRASGAGARSILLAYVRLVFDDGLRSGGLRSRRGIRPPGRGHQPGRLGGIT